MKNKDCKTCGGDGVVTFLVETRAGCGGWFSTDGRIFTEDYGCCPTCNPLPEGCVHPGKIFMKAKS